MANKTIVNWYKKHKILTIVGSILLFLVIVGALAGPEDKAAQQQANKTEQPAPAEHSQQEPQYVFDVPSLVGKNIDEVRSTLGKPADKESEPNAAQRNLGSDFWDNTFNKNDKELLVSFNPSTRHVIDFFISSDDPTGVTKDKAHLLQLGNITEDSSTYKVEFVAAVNDSTSYTGVKVIPN